MASLSDGSMTILVLHHRHGSLPTAASAESAEFNIIPHGYESLKIPIFEKKQYGLDKLCIVFSKNVCIRCSPWRMLLLSSRKLLRLRTTGQLDSITASALHHTRLLYNQTTQRIVYEQKTGTHFQIKQKSFRQRATGIELLILHFMNLP